MQQINEWKSVIIRLDPEFLEVLSPVIMAMGADGIEELEKSFRIYFPSQNWNAQKENLLAEAIRNYFPEFDKRTVETEIIPAENWNESWKESFRTFRVTERLVIRPDWEQYTPVNDEQVIVIAPKMAFGTGHHETTQLVLQMMEKYVRNGMQVLDAGTGSGVLAIYAGMLGAASVVAFDNDPVAIENTQENFRLNHVQIPHTIFTGSLGQVHGAFELILANIERNILLELSEGLTSRIEDGGIIILSGLLFTDRELILNHYAGLGWKFIESAQKNEWITLVLQHG